MLSGTSAPFALCDRRIPRIKGALQDFAGCFLEFKDAIHHQPIGVSRRKKLAGHLGDVPNSDLVKRVRCSCFEPYGGCHRRYRR